MATRWADGLRMVKACDAARVLQTPYTQAEIAAMAEAIRAVQPGAGC